MRAPVPSARCRRSAKRRRSCTEVTAMDFRSPRWLGGRGAVGGNLQTIWPALYSKRYHGPAPVYRRERWPTPDGDFIDVDFQVGDESADAPMLVLFHGLEGSSA